MKQRVRQIVGLSVLFLAAALFMLLRYVMFRDPVTLEVGMEWPSGDIAVYRRNPVLVGLVVGGGLAVAGTLLQALLRNPLASPYVLGVSSGAGVGVMFALYVQYLVHGAESYQRGGAVSETLPAIVGAVATLAVVYGLSQRRGWLDPVSLILIGVIVATMCGAIMLLLQSLVPTGLRGQFLSWIMGHISEAPNPWTLWIAVCITVFGLAVSIWLGRAMDAATMTDAEAHSVGVSIVRLRLWLFLLAGVLTAATVSLAGPIGFVGLVAPHMARLLIGPRHTPLVVGAALCGVMLVIGSDVLRQVVDLGAGRVPIGVVTALIGGPLFLWLLVTGRGQS